MPVRIKVAQASGRLVTPPAGGRRVALRLFALACAALFFAACSHYRLGTGGQLAFTTLYVAPVENDAAIPQAAALFGTQLRDALLRDGRVQLVGDPAAADATLTVHLAGYERHIATRQAEDTGLARKLELDLAATATLHDNRTGRDLFTARPITVTRQAFTDSGQLQAEYQTLPHLAAALADRTAHAVLDVW